MKKGLFTIILAGLMLGACGQRTTATSTEETTAEPTARVRQIDQNEFMRNVFNYEENAAMEFPGERPAIVDFYADWCGPCQLIAPIMEELAEQYNGRIDIYKVDIDENKELAAALNIQSIPLVMFLPVGEAPVNLVGARSKAQYEEHISDILLN